jgi:hypothetical protein
MWDLLATCHRLTEHSVRFYLAEIILAVEKLHKVGTLLYCSSVQLIA